MTLPNGETVTRIRATPGGYDPFGDPLPGTTDELEISGCAISPRAQVYTSELTGPGRRAVIDGVLLYAPYGSDILPSDDIVVRGVTYRVDGEPGSWRSPYTGARRGIEITLERVTEGAA